MAGLMLVPVLAADFRYNQNKHGTSEAQGFLPVVLFSFRNLLRFFFLHIFFNLFFVLFLLVGSESNPSKKSSWIVE